MVKLFQILPDDTECIGILLIKSKDPQSYSNGYKRSIFTLVYYKFPIYVYQQWFHSFEIGCK